MGGRDTACLQKSATRRAQSAIREPVAAASQAETVEIGRKTEMEDPGGPRVAALGAAPPDRGEGGNRERANSSSRGKYSAK